MDDEKGHFGMETYLFHDGIEKNLLDEIQVLRDHDHHINIPTFHKTLYGRFYILVGYGMNAVPTGKCYFQKIE